MFTSFFSRALQHFLKKFFQNLYDVLFKNFLHIFLQNVSSFSHNKKPPKVTPKFEFFSEYHIENQKSWLRVMAKYSKIIAFKGVIVTGWQRYDHFAVLCELLPVSIPSLVKVALLLEGWEKIFLHVPVNIFYITDVMILGTMISSKNVSNEIRDILLCEGKSQTSSSCRFPGVEIYNAVMSFSNLRARIDEVLHGSLVKGWLSAHNLKIGYFNARLVSMQQFLLPKV